jgi:hypothetical protein
MPLSGIKINRMKKLSRLALPAIITAILFCFNSCVKDSCTETHSYTFFEPVYKTSAEVRTNIKSNAPRQLERPGKLFIKGNYIFLNELDRGIHVIDNADPSHPKNIAFIDIPGNEDMAVKGNILYADLYTDMVALDISNPANVVLKKVIEGVFPYRVSLNGFMMDTTKVIVDWVKRDTTVVQNCHDNNWWNGRPGVFMFNSSAESKSNGAAPSPFGMGGSMARFTIVNERLYSVTQSDLNVFDISNMADPYFTKKVNIGWSIETIYPFKNNLFIGSSAGMFVYSINNPDNPYQVGQFSHVRSCDPVIADDDYAFVTLRSGSTCQGFNNQLDILRLNTLTDPTLVKSYQLTNPHGLSKDGDLLFICDGADGLKIFNAASVSNLHLVKKIGGIETYDVIAWNNIAFVSAKDGLYQYDYSNINDIRLLSTINFKQ